MCAPSHTLAATAAAVPHSRSAGARSPIASFRNDLRDGPVRIGRSRTRNRSRCASASKRMLRSLGEAQTRIHDDRLPPDAGRDRAIDRRLQLVDDLVGNVVIDGLPIHVPGSTAVVHEDDRRARFCDRCGKRRLVPRRADVVDHGRAARDGLPRDGCLVGIDRHRHAAVRRQPVDDRQHAPQLFLFRERRRRPGGWIRLRRRGCRLPPRSSGGRRQPPAPRRIAGRHPQTSRA